MSPEDFIKKLAGNPEMLGRFISKPDDVMTEHGIPPEDRDIRGKIKNTVAHQVHYQLGSQNPDALTVIMF